MGLVRVSSYVYGTLVRVPYNGSKSLIVLVSFDHVQSLHMTVML